MNLKLPSSGVRCWLMAIAIMLMPHTSFCAEVVSIAEFVSHRDKWPEMVGTSWVLEGRYAAIADNRVHFTNCSLPVVLSADTIRSRNTTSVVEVTGKLLQEEGKLVLRAERLVWKANDLDYLEALRSNIRTDSPNDWYRVADWAEKRGSFYKDSALLTAAQELNGQGLITEFRNQTERDPQSLQRMLQKAREKNVNQKLVDEMIHESLWKNFRLLKANKADQQKLLEFENLITEHLPDAAEQRESYPILLANPYLIAPERLYEAASPEQRKMFRRVFLLAVIESRILTQADDKGANGFEIAEQIRQTAPERIDLIQHYEDLSLTNRINRLTELNESELQNLAKQLEDRGREEEAVKLKTNWLQSAEQRLQFGKPEELLTVANQWISLLNDEQNAIRVAMQASKRDTRHPDVISWLTSRGYRFSNSEWKPIDQEEETERVSPEQLAIEQGEILKGMTLTQAKAALKNESPVITRIVSNGNVTEIWQSSRWIVQLTRRSGSSEMRVIAVRDVNAEPVISGDSDTPQEMTAPE